MTLEYRSRLALFRDMPAGLPTGSPTLIGSYVAALVAEPRGLRDFTGIYTALAELEEPPNAALAVLAANQALFEDTVEEAVRCADLAVRHAELPPGPALLDWEPPAELLQRCRHTRLQVAITWGEPLDAVPRRMWQSDALDEIGTVEAERVVSAIVAFRLGHEVVPVGQLMVLEEFAAAGATLAPEVARGWAAAGDLGRARTVLDRRIALAVEEGDDPDVIERCRLCLLELALRYGLAISAPEMLDIHRSGTDAEQRAASFLTGGVGDPVPPPPDTWAPGHRGRALLDAGLTSWERQDQLRLLGAAIPLLEEADDTSAAVRARQKLVSVTAAALAETRTEQDPRPLPVSDGDPKPDRRAPRRPGPASPDDPPRDSIWVSDGPEAERVLPPHGRHPLMRVALALLYLAGAGGAVLAVGSVLSSLTLTAGLVTVLALIIAVILGGLGLVALLYGWNASLTPVATAVLLAGAGLGAIAAAFPEGLPRTIAYAVAFLPSLAAVAGYFLLRGRAAGHAPAYRVTISEHLDEDHHRNVFVHELGLATTLDGGMGDVAAEYLSPMRSARLIDPHVLPESPIRLDLVPPPGYSPVAIALVAPGRELGVPWEHRLAEGVPEAVRPRLVVFRPHAAVELTRRRWLAAMKEAYMGPPDLALGRTPPAPAWASSATAWSTSSASPWTPPPAPACASATTPPGPAVPAPNAANASCPPASATPSAW
ncbi:hypothetical protein OIE66_20385 [Nonomuraea sp. NBC_01738]|uniref:hypothetical protein n=1 Tax=Nonomuraea sp. NBC_01738 TaxID=2976003 RepID=UPI002E0D25BD|nr:hypothetical protein OIE66_20385 [Nonomuraea sp. NBC_01738]